MKFIIVLWAVVWVLIAFAFMGLFSDAFAWDYFKTMGTQYNINPEVCIMLPDPEVESRVVEIQNATTNALDEWETKLKDHTDGNWTIYREIYEWKDHGHLTTDDFDCGAFVNYSGQLDSYMAQHGVLGTATIDIDKGYYWLEIQTQVIKRTIQIYLGATFNESTSDVKSVEAEFFNSSSK